MLDEPEMHLHADVIVPDLAGWRRGRLAALPDAPAPTLAPDWVCEVVPPSTPASPPNPSERLGSKRVSLPRTRRPEPLSVRLS